MLINCRQFRKQQLPAILKELKSIIFAEYNKLIADKLPSIAVDRRNPHKPSARITNPCGQKYKII